MRRTSVLLAVMMLAGRAYAGGGESPDDIAKRNAQARFDEGITLAAKGSYEEARIKFVQAYAVFKTPIVLFNLAMAEKKSNHLPEAATHFRQVAADARSTAEAKDKAKTAVDELSRQTGRIAISAPAGADVTVDGALVGKAPLGDSIDVMPGTHAVVATLNGKHLDKSVSVTIGTEEKCELVDPNAQQVGNGNGVIDHPPPPQTTTTSFWSPGRFIGLSMIGAGVVAGGFVIGFGLGASDAASHASQLRQQIGDVSACTGTLDARCAELSNASAAKRSNETGAIAFGVISGALIVGGAAVMLFSPGTTRRAGVRVQPTLGGVMIEGRFQ